MSHNGLRRRVHRDELVATFKVLAIAVVILPLPNEELDALFGLNPQRIWMIVVFIAGLSLFGYLLTRVVDHTTAIGVTGALGGCVSPGLTITSLTEQSRRYPEFSLVYAFGAAIAVMMLFPRNLIIVGIVDSSAARSMVGPFIVMTGIAGAVAGLLWHHMRTRVPPTGTLDSPPRIRSALVFGSVIAAILLVVDVLELSIPSEGSQIGILLITSIELISYVGVTWTGGAVKMAQVLLVIFLASASAGIAFVILT